MKHQENIHNCGCPVCQGVTKRGDDFTRALLARTSAKEAGLAYTIPLEGGEAKKGRTRRFEW